MKFCSNLNFCWHFYSGLFTSFLASYIGTDASICNILKDLGLLVSVHLYYRLCYHSLQRTSPDSRRHGSLIYGGNQNVYFSINMSVFTTLSQHINTFHFKINAKLLPGYKIISLHSSQLSITCHLLLFTHIQVVLTKIKIEREPD